MKKYESECEASQNYQHLLAFCEYHDSGKRKPLMISFSKSSISENLLFVILMEEEIKPMVFEKYESDFQDESNLRKHFAISRLRFKEQNQFVFFWIVFFNYKSIFSKDYKSNVVHVTLNSNPNTCNRNTLRGLGDSIVRLSMTIARIASDRRYLLFLWRRQDELLRNFMMNSFYS